MRKFACLCLTLMLLLAAFPAQASTYTNMRETAIAYMDITFACGCKRTGAGTMVAVNGMLTAGHNLVCHTHNKKVKTCAFYFGYASKSDYYYKYNDSFTYTYYCDFSNGYASKDDIGYIKFPTDVGKRTGWYATSVESDSDLSWEHCHTQGFKNGSRVYDWGVVTVADARQITWTRSSSFQGCCEGGPLYYDYEGLEFPVLVAVYTSYDGATGYARRLTNQIFNDMKQSGINFN